MTLRHALMGISSLSCLCFAGCTASGTFDATTPAGTAHIDYVAATAALDDAVTVASIKGVSSAALVKIQAGGAAFEAAVEAEIDALMAGGSAETQAESAAAAAVASSAGSLGALLTAAHGSSVTQTDLAVAGGLGALQQLPAVVSAIIEVRNGYAPSAADLAVDLTAMRDAASRLAALTAG